MTSMTSPTRRRQHSTPSTPVFAGVDTHKELHVAAVTDAAETVLGTRSFPTTRQGYRTMLAWVRGHGELVRVGIEGTGSYGAGLTRHLAKAEVAILEVDRPDRSDRRRKGKDDDPDAIKPPGPRSTNAALPCRSPGTARSRRSAFCAWPGHMPSGNAVLRCSCCG